MVDIDLHVRELSDRTWNYTLETKIYWCDPEDRDPLQSEFDREVVNHYYLIKENFEEISELVKE